MRVIRTAILAVILPAIAYAHGGGRDIKGTIVPRGKETGVWQDMRAGSRVLVHIGHDGKAIEVHLPARK